MNISDFFQLLIIRLFLVLMEEQKLSIMQRNKINYILRSGQSLPVSKPIAKATNNSFPGLDKMRAKNARRRTLDAIKASGGYDRAMYGFKSIHFYSSLLLHTHPMRAYYQLIIYKRLIVHLPFSLFKYRRLSFQIDAGSFRSVTNRPRWRKSVYKRKWVDWSMNFPSRMTAICVMCRKMTMKSKSIRWMNVIHTKDYSSYMN